ncbi:hypothetical protein [Nitrobacter vulgaris]|uniref:Uncharacterized protein n=1 Tax=Nitrobacter vulgaris TaxID=29421 RepID=A0A1V4HYH3_NITVU|nr:hypothetical protein [Nitrobacter vulgaris]OPH83038.1 hypothetical protein B2M20_08580 [Nitrobacter vulgaris]
MDAAAEFGQAAAVLRWFTDMQWLDKRIAIDCLQALAESAGVVDELGHDEVQRRVADAFAPTEMMEFDCDALLVMQWKLADPRDRWRRPGELPENRKTLPAKYRTPQSTVDAFKFIVRTGSADDLAAWLRRHPDDAPALVGLLEAA